MDQLSANPARTQYCSPTQQSSNGPDAHSHRRGASERGATQLGYYPSALPAERVPVVRLGNAQPLSLQRNRETLAARHSYVKSQDLATSLERNLSFVPFSIQPILDGYGSAVFRAIDRCGLSLILKVQVFQETHPLAHEFVLLRNLRYLDPLILCPHPLLLDLSGEDVPHPLLVMNDLCATSLLWQYEHGLQCPLETFLPEIAPLLKRIHQLPVTLEGLGPLTEDCLSECLSGTPPPPKLRGSLSPSSHMFAKLAASLAHNALTSLVSRGTLLAWRRFCESDDLIPTLPSILHGDPSLRNFLFRSGHCHGIIDGSGTIGWPIEDVASCCVFLWATAVKWDLGDPQCVISRFVRLYDEDNDDTLLEQRLKRFVFRKAISRILSSARFGSRAESSSVVDLVNLCVSRDPLLLVPR